MLNINNNIPTPNELNNNEILFSDISQNVILNCINSDFSNFAKNENEVNGMTVSGEKVGERDSVFVG